MTDNEAFEAWAENEGYQPDYLNPSKGNYRDVIRDIHEAWNAALAYLRSQGEPVAWMHGIGAHRFFSFSKDYIVDVSPAVPLYLAPVAKVPEGWRLVPMEPTPEMLRATWGVTDREGYRRMLAVAPEYKEE